MSLAHPLPETEDGEHEQLAARLRSARREANLTQQAAAESLGISRPLLVAIEKGQRPVRPNELTAFAQLYGRQVNELLRPTPPLVGLEAQLRTALSSAPRGLGLDGRVAELTRLGEDYLELARLSRTSLPRRYPPAVDIEGLDIPVAAEDIAVDERNRLGLGDGPIPGLRQVLEDEVGIAVFVPRMPSRVAGVFVFANPLGGCVAVNSTHPVERQRWTLAHEFGHFLTSRTRPEVTLVHRYDREPASERFADAFAANFLMPRDGLRRRYRELAHARQGDVTPADLLRLAHLYKVSLQALVLRLETLRLLRSGTFRQLADLGFRPGEGEQIIGLRRHKADQELLPQRYRYLAVELFRKGEISEGQLARFLRRDRLGARETVADLSVSDDVEASGKSVPLLLLDPPDDAADE